MNVRRKKYRRVVDAVYGEHGVNTHSIPNLLHYALMTPGKLPKIGKYLEKRAKEAMAKKRVVPVEISMHIYCELIKTCHTDLALFAVNVKEMMVLLLSSPMLEMKGLGTETFVRFAEHGGMQFELENFVDYFITMSSSTDKDPSTQKRLRVYGLRGLHAYIVMTDDLDNFIAKFLDNSHASSTEQKLISIILDNMQFEGPNEPEELATLDLMEEETSFSSNWETASIRALSAWCLKDMSARVNNMTIRPLSESVLNYLDQSALWVPNDFATQVVKCLSIGLQPSLQHNTILYLLHHLEKPHIEGETEIKTHIVRCLIDVLPNTVSGPIIEILSNLMRQLFSASELDDLVASPDGVGELSNVIIQCVGRVVCRVNDSVQRLEALNYILSFFDECNSTKAKDNVGRTVLEVSQNLKQLHATKNFPPTLVERLLENCIDENSQVRTSLQKSLNNVLTSTGLISRLASNRNMESNPSHSSFYSNPYEFYEERLRSTLLDHAKMKNNTPLNFSAIFETLNLLILHLREQEIIKGIPMIFELQRSQAEEGTPQSRSVHYLIAAYLKRIGFIFQCLPLNTYILQVEEQRASSNQSDKHFETTGEGVLKVLKTKYRSKEKKDETVVSHLFSRESVVEFLETIPDLKANYENVSKLLMKSVKIETGEEHLDKKDPHGKSSNEVSFTRRRLYSVSEQSLPSVSGTKSKEWTVSMFKDAFDESESEQAESPNYGSPLPFSLMCKRLEKHNAELSLTIGGYTEKVLQILQDDRDIGPSSSALTDIAFPSYPIPLAISSIE